MLEAVAKLEKLMEDFTAEYIDYDLSSWNGENLSKLEERLYPFPLRELKIKVHKACVARAEADNAKMREDRIARWKRCKYYKAKYEDEDPKKKEVSIYKELEVVAYEQVCVILAYELMKESSVEEIHQKIKTMIPSITVEEIEEYLAKGKKDLQCFSRETFDALFIKNPTKHPTGGVNLIQAFNQIRAIGEIKAFRTVCRLLELNESITAQNIGFYDFHGID